MENLQLFTRLFNKYLDNRCSPEEVDYLLESMHLEEYKAQAKVLIENRLQQTVDINNGDASVREKLDIRLQSILNEAPVEIVVQTQPRIYKWRWVAAAGILIVAAIGAWWFGMNGNNVQDQSIVKEVSKPISPAVYTRYITLPDGSTVVLHAGSKLEYPDSFQTNTREVLLTGEAYFDVVHNPEKPFVIYTGKVKTTVLGTAFNIKADEKQVTVSVTRGKVKVESGSKVLAVLTPDQQVKFNVPDAVSEQVTVNAKSIVTGWASENMVFDEISFEEIADILSKRYGVVVAFKNESLKKCKLRASFSGTETLEQVASVLSGIKNGTYRRAEDGSIVFDGDGCN